MAALPVLPDQIPAHYDYSGQVTRWGSKYEALILPAVTLLFGLFMLGMARFCARREENGHSNEKVCLVMGIVSMLLFDGMTGFFLYTAFGGVESLSSVRIDINQLVCGLLGLSMVVVGNVMPKLRMNSLMGLRTGWSMKNETTWKKSQRFGGISFIIGGLAIILFCFWLKGTACFWTAMGILILLSVMDVWYTYRIAKQF